MSAISELYFRFRFRSYHQSRHVFCTSLRDFIQIGPPNRTHQQTNIQMNRPIALSRSRCRELRLNNLTQCWFRSSRWVISLVFSLSGYTRYSHRPQGVNYRGYLHVLKYLLFLSCRSLQRERLHATGVSICSSVCLSICRQIAKTRFS